MKHDLVPSFSVERRRFLGVAVALAVMAPLAAVLPASAEDVVIGMMPKFTSDPYFVAANAGAQEAAKELGITVEFNGPVDANVAAHADIIDRWTRRKVTAIAVSPTTRTRWRLR